MTALNRTRISMEQAIATAQSAFMPFTCDAESKDGGNMLQLTVRDASGTAVVQLLLVRGQFKDARRFKGNLSQTRRFVERRHKIQFGAWKFPESKGAG